ncbi:bifunctional GNAT family N-acetyltransferase/acetate--CoA ligase family protein [Leekyejoonella antrihumi]|uniref:bifunctional acetate--CoA ligase family protein/GNAT family N-acetyltransferase n=1 Tax=Leekyejoonella antrihumi TaxID=1660198 RepID=UPI001FEC3519|nr:bifunctional GNAT family N-acetyltransferase/acetate--CoA ligase family protein [Leekyejoonella antrihumi]
MPHDYPHDWEADVVLRDGSVAQVRPIRPDDAPAIQDFHERQSDESIYLRFFAPLKRLSEKDLHRFTHVDYDRRVALVMESRGALVGVARYDMLDDTRAECAFNVSDTFQGRGIGSVLLEHLAAIGRENGVQEFLADVLPQNRKMLSVFTDAGFEVSHHFDDGVVALSFRIEQTQQSQAVRTAREQRAEAVSVRALLAPSSVAVVGVSERPEAVGRGIFEHLVAGGFAGDLYAVNSHQHKELAEHRVYASVAELPGPVDLAVLAVPAGSVHDVVLGCADLGVKALLVVAAGFAEAGEEGARLQRELLTTVRRHGMRIVGPNSFGLINTRPEVRLNASFAPEMPRSGSLGLFSQSGALGIAVLDSAARRGLGLSDFVSAGNRVDVSGNDIMQFWIDDESTRAVGLYLESMGNPRKFSRIARRLSERKPVIVVKSAASAYGVPPGHRVRTTRVGSAAFGSMLRQAGVLRVENVHQLLDVGQLVVHQPIPRGNRVAVVGNSDALNALAADAAIGSSLEVVHGPVNLPPDVSPDGAERALEAAFADPDVDSVITGFVQTGIGQGVAIARTLSRVAAPHDKPCITTFLGIKGLSDELSGGATTDGRAKVVPSYAMPEDGVVALAAATQYGAWRATDRGELVMPDGIDAVSAEAMIGRVLNGSPGGRPLQPDEVAELLAAYGVTVWPVIPVSTEDEAVEAAQTLGYPVVVKSVSPLVRRSPITAVRADLRHESALRDAFTALDERLRPLHANRLVVQGMANPGIPCILATGEDPLFGPVVSFSLAGAPTVMGDVGYRIPPLAEGDVRDLVDSVRAAPLLHGQDGSAPIDRAALEDLIARLSVLAENLPEVASLTLDAVNVHPDGLEVLGATATVAPSALRADAGRRALGVPPACGGT